MKLFELFLGSFRCIVADKLTQLDHHRVSDAVVDRCTLASPADEPRIVEHMQVFGNIRLLSIER